MLRNTFYQHVDRENPEAAGVCDRGGEVRRLRDLHKEMQWRGNRLVWNGFLCCAKHIDKPQPFDKTLILPADPVPVPNPRPVQLMPPLPFFENDGVPTINTTASYVLQTNGAPVLTVAPKKYPE